MRILGAMLLVLGLGVTAVRGQDKQCMYANEFFSPGTVSCQGGAQYRCVAGSWQPIGLGCADTKADADEEGLRVDPSRGAPTVGEPGIKQPSAPTVPRD